MVHVDGPWVRTNKSSTAGADRYILSMDKDSFT